MSVTVLFLVQVIMGAEASAVLVPYETLEVTEILNKPTGFFHTHQEDGIWWLVDPNGYAFYMVGVSHVRFSGQGCERLGYSPYQQACMVKYGSEEAWGESTVSRLKGWGFNALGELSDRSLQQRGLAHTAFRPFGYRFGLKDGLPTPSQHSFTVFPNVFSPEWEKHCDLLAKEYCLPQKDDPWLIGYFIDNELTWMGSIAREWGLFSEAWKKPIDDPAKQAWIEFLQEHMETVLCMQEHWGVSVSSWSELAHHTQPIPPYTDHARTIADEWVRLVATHYFETVTNAIRKYDPNHLILGPRFVSDVPDVVLEVAGQYCDVISVNFYPRFAPGDNVSQHEIDQMQRWFEVSEKPLLISEWSFPAFDSGLPCTLGAGMRVENQLQRAACWATFQQILFQMPSVLGSIYFTWSDEPAFGISAIHTENTNYGIVNEHDDPYTPIIEKAKMINPMVYKIHKQASLPQGTAKRAVQSDGVQQNESTVFNTDSLLRRTGALSIQFSENGDNGWSLMFHDQPLALLQPTIIQIAPGWAWSRPTKTILEREYETDSFVVLDIRLTNAPEPNHKGEGLYNSVWRVHLPKTTPNWLMVQCLWIENVGEKPWRLLDVLFQIRSTTTGNGGYPADLDHHWRPFYRNGSFFWDKEAQLGLGFTCLNPEDYEYYVGHHQDGYAFGDFRHIVDCIIAPNSRYDTPLPPAVLFLMEHGALTHFARKGEWILPQLLPASHEYKASWEE